jgi:hypothetical protein
MNPLAAAEGLAAFPLLKLPIETASQSSLSAAGELP